MKNTSTPTIPNVNIALYMGVEHPVAELRTSFGGNVVIQLNKKLTWFQRLCYNVLGFEYKTL